MELTGCVNLNVSLLCCDCLFCHTLILFSSFLFVSNCFLLTLACTGVVLCALSAHGKADTVTDTTVAANVHKALDVELNLAAEVTLYLVVSTNHFTHLCCLSIGPVFHFDIDIDACFLKDCLCCAASDTKNIVKAISPLLFCGKSTPTILTAIILNYDYLQE